MAAWLGSSPGRAAAAVTGCVGRRCRSWSYLDLPLVGRSGLAHGRSLLSRWSDVPARASGPTASAGTHAQGVRCSARAGRPALGHALAPVNGGRVSRADVRYAVRPRSLFARNPERVRSWRWVGGPHLRALGAWALAARSPDLWRHGSRSLAPAVIHCLALWPESYRWACGHGFSRPSRAAASLIRRSVNRSVNRPQGGRSACPRRRPGRAFARRHRRRAAWSFWSVRPQRPTRCSCACGLRVPAGAPRRAGRWNGTAVSTVLRGGRAGQHGRNAVGVLWIWLAERPTGRGRRDGLRGSVK